MENIRNDVAEADFLALLDALDELARVHQLSPRFNIFEALDMVRAEIRHSRFLAFLLDPSQPHGLDDLFLKAMILSAADSQTPPELSKLQLAIADYSDARVYCERDHFDITVELPSLRLLFVIENKIDAAESADQLEGYRKKALGLYPDYRFFGCFLTPEGYAGEDSEWAFLSYVEVRRNLKKLCSAGGLRTDVRMAIDHYLELIEKKIMPSKELIDACKRIYRQHRTVLDLIYQHGSESLLDYGYQEFRSRHEGLSEALLSRKGFLSFAPASWLQIDGFSVADRGKWELPCPIKFWFQTTDKSVFLKLEVGPVDAGTGFDRSGFVSKLRAEFGVKETKRKSELFTRILSRSEKFNPDDDTVDLDVLLERLWQKIQGDDVLKRVDKVARACLAGQSS